MSRINPENYRQPVLAAIRRRLEAGQSVGDALRGARVDADAPVMAMQAAVCEALGVDAREASRLIAREITLQLKK